MVKGQCEVLFCIVLFCLFLYCLVLARQSLDVCEPGLEGAVRNNLEVQSQILGLELKGTWAKYQNQNMVCMEGMRSESKPRFSE